VTDAVLPIEESEAAPPAARRWSGLIAPTSPAPVIAGVVVVAVGFLLIAIGWARVAGLTNVALQMPYLVSAGITGLALVMVGLLVINLAVKRQDAAERRRQFEALAEAVRELRERPR
jgi:uncharacterized membrane protein